MLVLFLALPAIAFGDELPSMLAMKWCSTSDPCNCKCMEPVDGKTDSGTPIQLWDCDASSDTQEWLIERSGYPPSIVIAPIKLKQDPSKCIDVAGGSFQNGAHLQIWDCNGLPQQNWFACSLGVSGCRETGQIWLKNGIQPEDFVIDIPGGDATNGARLQIWQNDNLKTQSWDHWQHDGPVPTPDGCPGPSRRRRGSTVAAVATVTV